MVFGLVDYTGNVFPLPRYKVSVHCRNVNGKMADCSGGVIHNAESPDIEVNVTLSPEIMVTALRPCASVAAVVQVTNIIMQCC